MSLRKRQSDSLNLIRSSLERGSPTHLPIRISTPETKIRTKLTSTSLGQKQIKYTFVICSSCGTKVPKTEWSEKLHSKLCHSQETTFIDM